MSFRCLPHFMKWYPRLHSCLENLSQRKAPWFCTHLWIVKLWQFGCNNIVESACDGKGCKRRRRLCFVMMLRSQQVLGFGKGVLWQLYDMKELFTKKEFKSSIFNYYGCQVQRNVWRTFVEKVAPKSVQFEGKKFWNHHIYSIGSSRLPNRARLWTFTTFLSNMKPNLVNSLCVWSSMWLHHKIWRKKNKNPVHHMKPSVEFLIEIYHKIQMQDRK